jgi:hypothetical protein
MYSPNTPLCAEKLIPFVEKFELTSLKIIIRIIHFTYINVHISKTFGRYSMLSRQFTQSEFRKIIVAPIDRA